MGAGIERNTHTRKAIEELNAGKGNRFNSADALFKDLVQKTTRVISVTRGHNLRHHTN